MALVQKVSHDVGFSKVSFMCSEHHTLTGICLSSNRGGVLGPVQGYKLDVTGKCVCDPTTAGPGCAFCIVPGSCGSAKPGAKNLKACADFGTAQPYGRAYNFVRDAVSGLGRCECNAASVPHCAACLFPGVCLFCNAPFELVGGKCGEASST